MKIADINNKKKESNGDFKILVNNLKSMGIKSFKTFASNGNSIYLTNNNESLYDDSNLFDFNIGKLNKDNFLSELIKHQNGKTDFPTWLKETANSGIYYWVVDINEMVCSYFDLNDNIIYTEIIK